MEKSLFRAFIISLVVFFGLNFLIYITMYSLASQVVFEMELDRIATHPTHAAYLLIYPSVYFPWELIFRGIDASTLPFTILFIGGVVTFVIAAIVAGLMGGDIGKSFGGWVLTCLTFITVHIVILIIDESNISYVNFYYSLVEAIIWVIIAGAVNMLIFGGLVILIAYLKGSD